MDFFESQEIARRKTLRLVGFFILAVVLIVICIYLAVRLVVLGVGWEADPSAADASLWKPGLFFATAAATLGVIASGSLYKTMSLAGGGLVVAETLGGRLINRSTRNRDERILLNVVDEMAIASGVPSPPVYILDGEDGINAFAAGFETDDAVIGVTKGCLQWLSRDELQGVVAHEFSHILNGDMRLNMRLMGLLHGILLLALTGYWIMRSTRGGGGKGRAGAIVFLGIALLVIGYVGVFFAKLIKAGVSRQREYLADASAVQFTRDPEGIAGALKKIGGLSAGTRIKHSQAEQASHMFFGNALKKSFLNLFSTHPPLADRIRRIDPSFAGSFPKAERPRRSADDIRPLSGFHSAGEQQWSNRVPFHAAEAVVSVGNPLSGGIESLPQDPAALQEELQQLVQEPFAARAVIYGLLLDHKESLCAKQLARLSESADPAVFRELNKHRRMIDRLPAESRLPLVELALPALETMSRRQFAAFRDNLKHLIRSDEQIRLFEFLLWRMVESHLQRRFDGTGIRKSKRPSRKAVIAAGADLLAALAHVGHDEGAEVTRAYQRSMGRLVGSKEPKRLPGAPERLDLSAADRALSRLSQVGPKVKKRILEACAVCIETDGVATIEEIQVLRVIALSLGCPIPSVMSGSRANS